MKKSTFSVKQSLYGFSQKDTLRQVEPLKHLYSTELVESLSGQVKNLYSDFDEESFVARVADDQ
jgi:hypothetical protein